MNNKNPRNAGRKPLSANKKMVRYTGGLVPPETLKWIADNDGISAVRAAIDFYRKNNG